MNLSSLASNALATTRSTFKGLAEAAVASGDQAAPQSQPSAPAPAPRLDVMVAEPAQSTEPKPKGVRRGTVLDAYA